MVSLTPFSSPHGGLESRNKRQHEWHAQFLLSFPAPASLLCLFPSRSPASQHAGRIRPCQWSVCLPRQGLSGLRLRQGRGCSTLCILLGAAASLQEGQRLSWPCGWAGTDTDRGLCQPHGWDQPSAEPSSSSLRLGRQREGGISKGSKTRRRSGWYLMPEPWRNSIPPCPLRRHSSLHISQSQFPLHPVNARTAGVLC